MNDWEARVRQGAAMGLGARRGGRGAAGRAPFSSAKRTASSAVWNSIVMCVLLSGSLVDDQPISGLVHRLVSASSNWIFQTCVF